MAALVHNDGTTQLADAARLGALVPATASLPLLILPGNGTADEETVQAAATLDPAVIVLSDATIRTTADSPVLEGPDGATLVRYTAGASGGGPGPSPRNTPAKVQQRMLSDTWIAARSAPAGSPAGRVRLVTDPNQTAGRGQRGDGTLAGRRHPHPAADRDAGGLVRRVPLHRQRPAQGSSAEPARRRPPAGRAVHHLRRSAGRAEDRPAEAAIALPRSVSLSWRRTPPDRSATPPPSRTT